MRWAAAQVDISSHRISKSWPLLLTVTGGSLAGMLLGPAILNWRAVRSTLQGLKIARQLPPATQRVGVFVDARVEQVMFSLRICDFSALQFHGQESPSFCRQFSVMTIKAFRMRDAASLEMMGRYAGWIALRFLNDPALASPHFENMATLAKTPHSASRAAYWRGRTAEATEHLQTALQLNPNLPAAHYELALLAEQAGQIAEADSHYAETLRLAPNDLAAHRKLGLLLARSGRLDSAAEHFRAIIRLAPADADAPANLGNVLLFQGRAREAIACYEESLRLRPGDALELLLGVGSGIARRRDQFADGAILDPQVGGGRRAHPIPHRPHRDPHRCPPRAGPAPEACWRPVLAPRHPRCWCR